MARLAVFLGPPAPGAPPPGRASVRRRLRDGDGIEYDFLPAPDGRDGVRLDPVRYAGALIPVDGRTTRRAVQCVRRALPGRPLGGLAVAPDASALGRIGLLGLDFLVEAWGESDPQAAAVRSHLERARRSARRARPAGGASRTTARRLAILTDVVKTANSILEPRKVIELVVERIRQLIPSDAWSLMMVDEETQELVFEAALGARARDVAAFRLRIGEGVAGWVAQSGKPAIVNDAPRDPRFSPRVDTRTQFETRSILCAPLVSRGRTIGVLEIINKRGGPFTRADLQLVLTLVEPCAIAIENAILFQRTEQLTITDDLTRLFNSRYLNLYLGREIKRCKRHGIPLSVIFLDLDGFKGINDQYGHLAGSGTLTEVGKILAEGVRESDILARYGGDEFVVVLPETPASGALVIAERLRRAVEEHRFLEPQGIAARISASFGISTYPDHALSPEGLIQKADQAMYRVKEREKNGIEVAV
ncbi:MAG TPA: sensor domain-containing diguanylate cyclase [Vicinamibacteria bacterium]|nr:sensor domain-containing diguanylate cyclase [Vicinamibacteria bacterium]